MDSRHSLVAVLAVAALLLASLACIGPQVLLPKPTATSPSAQTVVQTSEPNLKCKIPDLAGMDQQVAMKNLASLGLTPVKTLDYSDTIPVDALIATDPPAGTTLDLCRGDVIVVISMGPRQNADSTPSTLPTLAEPALAPTPDMGSALENPMYNIIYLERFNPLNNGLDPAWKVKINPGGAMSTKDGALVVTGTAMAQVGDTSWQNYLVTFSAMSGSGYSFMAFFRLQGDTSNSMAMSCTNQASSSGYSLQCEWFRIVNNARQKITGTYPAEVCANICNIVIEARDNTYRFLFNGVEQFKFTDSTYKNGGVGFYVNSPTHAWTLSAFDVSTPPHPASPGDLLFRDDFKTSAWDIGSSDGEFAAVDQQLVDGKYRWHIKAKKGVAVKECIKAIDLPEVFTLSVNVTVLSGPRDATYALVFRCQDNSNLYYFNVSENGPWGLYTLLSGNWTKIIGEDTSPVDAGQTNQLQVIGDGTKYALILNGHLLRQVIESEFQAGGIGLGAELSNPGDEATIEFDNVNISTP